MSKIRFGGRMAWLIVALVLIGVVGPLFWMLPSKRERQVGALRAAARSVGLVVELASVPKPDASAHERVSAGGVAREAKIGCAAYRLLFAEAQPAAPQWFLLKTSASGAGAEGDTPVTGWVLRETVSNTPRSAEYWQQVGVIINELPADCVAVETDAGQVAWYGRERLGDLAVDAAVADLRRGLTAIAALHGASAP